MSNQVRNQKVLASVIRGGVTQLSGIDFLKANKAHINFENNTLSIQENLLNVPLNSIETINEHYAHVKTIAVENVEKELGITINENLNSNQRQQLAELLTRNRKVFAKDITELGKTDYHYHRIDTGDAPPVQSMPYRQTPQMREETEKHIDIMLKNDIIEESNSPWSSPIVLVRKKKNNMDAKQEFSTGSHERIFSDTTRSRNKTQICICNTIAVDASDYAIGYVLGQLNPNTKLEHVVAYGGRSLNKNEQKKEGLALKEGIKHFNPYLATQKFTASTDNITVRWIDTIKNIQGRLGRWALELQGYDFEIMHRPGKKNNADALSRRNEIEQTVAAMSSKKYEIITFDYKGDDEQQPNILTITDTGNEDDETLEDIDPEQFKKRKTFQHLQRHCPDFV
ncbi:unnamed protein product [Mytilus coruscus]|uniref:Reverse transcriptase RNase H-like domain-containing protein n=1 Tax=Mytilus coruscus TaxID=42192 RepID=A0A6J8CBI7_MYTCO|nr:unnamed protein product [Mytilus coruscus]